MLVESPQEQKLSCISMNLAQFTRAYSVEQFSRWGVPFSSEEEALAAIDCFPLETKPERVGSIILYDAWEDYNIAARYSQKGILLQEHCHWRSLLFATPAQAQLAARRINEQLQAPAGAKGNQLIFQEALDEVAVYQAIASSEVEVVGQQVVVIPGIPDEDWVLLGDFCWIPVEFKEERWSQKPKLLIRDLDAAEAGYDRSIWIDAAQEPEVIVQMIAWWLGRSPVPDASWWRVIKMEDFPPGCKPKDQNNLIEISLVAQNWEQRQT